MQLQCRAIQNFPGSSSTSILRLDKVCRNVCQLQFKRENATCFKLACALPSHLRPLSSVSYAAHWRTSSLRSFGNSFTPFPGRYFSQVPNTGNKDKIVGGGDGKAGGVKKFNKKWKKHKVMASSEVELVASTEPVIGDVSSGIKGDLSTTVSPVSNGKLASTVKPRRRPKSKKVEDKSSSTVSVLEVATNPSVEVPRSSAPSNSKSEAGEPAVNYSSQSPNTGNKDNIVGGDEKAGRKKSGFNKFNKKSKKHKVLASSEAEVVTSTEPVIGDVSSGIKVELSTEASPASNVKEASAVKTKRRPKNKKVDDKSSSAAPVLEAVSVEESSKSVPKPKHSGSGNRKSSSAKVFNF